MPAFHNQFQPRATRATVYQLRADVLCPDGMVNAFARIIGLVLPFVAKSLYTKLPPEATERRSFEIQDEDRLCECIAVPERMLWAIRFKFASKDGTAWYYDLALVREDDRLIFGMKIDTAFGADVKALQANLPLVESLLGCGLLAQGRPVTANLWQVNTPEDVEELLALLEDPRRSLPVIAVSAVNWKAWRFTPHAPGYLVNASYLADRVKGYAIVAQISFQGAFALTDAVGKSWSVYDGACRTYFPKIDFDNGSPAHHPCNLKDKIWFWNYEGLRGERGYTAFLIDTAHRGASTSRTDWSGLYFVPDARILAAELEMAHAAHLANAPERELAMQNHIAALQRKLQTAEDENADWLSELEQATEEAEYYKQENGTAASPGCSSGAPDPAERRVSGQGNPDPGQLQGHGRMGKRTPRRAAGPAATRGTGGVQGRIHRGRDGLPGPADPRQRVPRLSDGHGDGQGVPGRARPIRHGLLRFHRQEPRRAGRRSLLRQLPHRDRSAGVPPVPHRQGNRPREPLLYADLLLLGRRHQSGHRRLAPVPPQQPDLVKISHASKSAFS